MKKYVAFLGFSLVGLLFFVSPAAAQETGKKISLKLQNSLPDGYATSQALARFAQDVNKKTNGQVEIVVFSTGQLFKDTDLTTALPSGAVDLALPNLGQFAGMVPSLAVMSLVGPFESAEQFYRLQEGSLGALWAKDMEERANSYLLSYMSLGATDIITSPKKNIKSIDDFKGLKMQCATKGMQIWAQALGAVPTSISAADIYIALQRATVDAAGSSGTSALTRKWYEVSKYQTKLIMNPEGPFGLLANLNVWKKIPKAHQDVMKASAREAWLWNRQQVIKQAEESWLALAKQKEVQIYEVPRETARQWAQAAAPATREYLVSTVGKAKTDEILDMIQKAK